MNPEALLAEIRAREDYAGQIIHLRERPARGATYAGTEEPLHEAVQQVLDDLGIRRLYSHQARAVDAALSGENVCTVSGTASGKTLTYVLPIMEAIHRRGTSRALLIYPTKALAQDQLRKLKDFGAGRLFVADTYDGDTPQPRRRIIKREAQVVLTNPDMLHLGILPYHHTWSEFFRNLDYVVLDEVHTYRGIFGSHTANIIRRLRRICAHYGAHPRFICCSATIANPGELCERLTGLPMRVIEDDGAPRGRKVIAFWNPPVADKLTGKRRSGNLEAADLMSLLVRRHVRNITFTLARSQAELILRYTRDKLSEEHLDEKIMAYRGGYLPAERREIERRLFDGDLLGVTATTALELGVDIGGLEAVIMAGYPGTISSTWQQMGRAGRAQEDSLAVMIGLSGAMHQYVVRNPDYLVGAGSEKTIIDPENSFILAAHLLCAAYELPVADRDTDLFGAKTPEILNILGDAGYITRRSKWYWTDPELYPAKEVSIRSASGSGYDIQNLSNGTLLGTMDAQSAQRMLHQGAVYLHAGQTYVVEELDLEARVAKVKPSEVDYYTQPLVYSEVRRLEDGETRQAGPLQLGLGPVSVRSQVTGYQMIRQMTEQALGSETLDMPMESYDTVGLWLLPTAEALASSSSSVGRGLVPRREAEGDGEEATAGAVQARVLQSEERAEKPAVQAALMPIDVAGALHAIEHVMIMLLPLVVACDAHDVGGIFSPMHPDFDGPVICLYDGYPGGVGISQAAFDRVKDLLMASAYTIENCGCDVGCPACVQQATCGSMNRPLDKCGALELLRRWLASWPATDESSSETGN
ncbi:MAG: DEAD/DEAH box helicase [Armatimonadota bacterium]